MRAHWQALAIEVGGFALALGIASIAVAHLLGTDRGSFVLSGGDSVFLEFVWQAIRDGSPMHWSLSAVLFLFPELPIYFALRAPAQLPQQAMIANALLSATLLFALIRVIVRLLRPVAHEVLISVSVFAVLAACALTESTNGYESFELVSFFFTGTFYYGTVLALFATVALVAVLINGATGWRHPRMLVAIIALGLISALCTLSNPLYVVWAGAPACLALVIVVWRTPLAWSRAIVVVIGIVGGAGLGMLLRVPFAQFASPVADPYIHPGRSLESVLYYGYRAIRLAATPLGAVEFILLFLLCAGAVAAFVIAVRGKAAPVRLLVAAVGLGAPIIVFAFNVVLGTESVRYLQPLYFAPLLSLALLATFAAERSHPATAPLRRVVTAVAIVVSAAVVVASVASFMTLRSIATTPYARVQCLEQWLDGRQLTGAGQFWNSRDLQAYGDESVHVVQVLYDFRTFPWLVNLAGYYDANVTYVIADAEWMPEVVKLLGPPSDQVACDSYTILDYAGAPGQSLLSATVTDTAQRYAIEQGFR